MKICSEGNGKLRQLQVRCEPAYLLSMERLTLLAQEWAWSIRSKLGPYFNAGWYAGVRDSICGNDLVVSTLDGIDRQFLDSLRSSVTSAILMIDGDSLSLTALDLKIKSVNTFAELRQNLTCIEGMRCVDERSYDIVLR